MSGFSAEWLDRRESADRRARNPDLLAALAQRLAGQESVRVADLGCGTGSNLRAIAPYLPQTQHWHLLDHDPALLDAARDRLETWADAAEASGGDLAVRHQGRRLTVSFHEADLAAGLEGVLPRADLVTAAALFDLVSVDWIARLVEAVSCQGALFYAALTYDGNADWIPSHLADEAVLGAFKVHQGRDKGFGPAAGPGATQALIRAFQAAGYRVRTAASPWRLGSADAALVSEIATGIAAAVRETGLLPDDEVDGWLQARTGAACVIGHTDLLALPPRRPQRELADAEP